MSQQLLTKREYQNLQTIIRCKGGKPDKPLHTTAVKSLMKKGLVVDTGDFYRPTPKGEEVGGQTLFSIEPSGQGFRVLSPVSEE